MDGIGGSSNTVGERMLKGGSCPKSRIQKKQPVMTRDLKNKCGYIVIDDS